VAEAAINSVFDTGESVGDLGVSLGRDLGDGVGVTDDAGRQPYRKEITNPNRIDLCQIRMINPPSLIAQLGV
jgi:hypothetical protein